MTTKSLLSVGILALASLTVASAKSYDIALDNAVKAGPVHLKAGSYTLKVKNNTATFTDASNGKTYTAPVKLDNSKRKNEQTAVTMANQKGSEVLQSIALGGSRTTLEFSN
ncbi:MAG: hypothetical protein WB579_02555 [Bryobacteraceae bacterium]